MPFSGGARQSLRAVSWSGDGGQRTARPTGRFDLLRLPEKWRRASCRPEQAARLAKAPFILNSAIETAKHAKYANRQGFPNPCPFTHWVKAF
jgi:hypothetical protein